MIDLGHGLDCDRGMDRMTSSAREPGRAMPSRTTVFCFTVFFLLLALDAGFAATQSAISPSLTLQAAEARDQDDLTFWLNPSDLSESTIITSDKKANKIFVYDLAGRTLQVVSAQKPGNIDTRYGFTLAKETVEEPGQGATGRRPREQPATDLLGL